MATAIVAGADGVFLIRSGKWHRPWYWLAKTTPGTLLAGRSPRVCGVGLLLWTAALMLPVLTSMGGLEAASLGGFSAVLLTAVATAVLMIGLGMWKLRS
jgi:hypothetical protein